ncbi:reverse transcriptase family protein [Marinomonas fungiae]|uniref:Reverse transcriptase (RNA-dependent DNA polymerase) n=1 Tax=Marinomonas fungiae TaxID=1137284 RepID=A0A0K6ITJ8_9GAMM|nr:reverse transcriptase family protein [Marinomonas fungiae]CUB06627.1 Reverse transcriptase (RNA-dependent DNA polymerase) [Marinomonas fungiae]
MKKKSKLKIRTNGKSYQLHDSPFYKLNSKKRLASLLNIEHHQLKQVLSSSAPKFEKFTQVKVGKKPRAIQKPTNSFSPIHCRLASLLCRIGTPDYLHSGKKGRSNLSNAKDHIGKHKLLAVDIKSFFESTSHEKVYSFFRGQLKCSPDIADTLCKLCLCDSHIPTGSQLSMPLAYWANSNMFDELEMLATKHSIKMSVYVDDVVFSGEQLNKLFLSTVKKICSRYGMTVHPDKVRLYSREQPKVVTGVAIIDGQLKVDHKQHKLLENDLKLWEACKDDPIASDLSLPRKISGRLSAMGSVEKEYLDRARSFRKKYSIR